MFANGITVKANNYRPTRSAITFDMHGHGSITVSLAALLGTLDEMAMHSTDEIREILADRVGPEYVPTWADRTELAAIWADIEHNKDGDPLAIL